VAFAQGIQVDPALPDYKPAAGVSGSIKSVGSDTMNNLMTLWSEGFLKFYPSVRVEIEGKGSSGCTDTECEAVPWGEGKWGNGISRRKSVSCATSGFPDTHPLPS